MGYEIDFLALGSETKSGDAICFRFGQLLGLIQEQRVVVVDGGFNDDGKNVVNHIRHYYRNIFTAGNPAIDLLISTHPDGDHIGGLQYILDNVTVRELWIHQPWRHATSIHKYINDDRYTHRGTKTRLQKELDCAYDLVQLARRKGVTVREPFQGLTGLGGVVTVLGPTREFYHEQLALFRLGGATLPALPNPGMSYEDYRIETLDDGGGTSPMNETSAILWVQTNENDRMLFTGDAGVMGLCHALIYSNNNNIPLSQANVVQIPHHGSRRNVNPVVLNAMLGVPPGIVHQPVRWAVASCAINGRPKHPSNRVINAFIRRRCSPLITAGTNIWLYRNAPARNNVYNPLSGIPLMQYVND